MGWAVGSGYVSCIFNPHGPAVWSVLGWGTSRAEPIGLKYSLSTGVGGFERCPWDVTGMKDVLVRQK